ncbi:MAG: NADH-quinone oxidoreductase subunit J [Phycisphaerales bacterium]|nr:NADH-quinone oxidoreductase subunit J [Phycisphaerales bacterium]
MDPTLAYFAIVLGAVALYLVLRPGSRAIKAAGAILGLGAFAWLLVEAGRLLGADGRPESFFLIFSVIAVASAVRLITHPKPVYSALYFIMVVLSSAALFLLLQAEFMAFALVIVYAGAILITYMFVLMLAQQAPGAGRPDAQPEYDIVPREPGAAAFVGFIMLTLLSYMVFTGAPMLPVSDPQKAQALIWDKLELMRGELQAMVERVAPGSRLVDKPDVRMMDDVAAVQAIRANQTEPSWIVLPADAIPNNVQLVGVDLVWKFPVSLELAGVILLMAMFGAVVLARKQIELGEDEVREAAGMRRLALHADEPSEQVSGGQARVRGGDES